MSEHSLSKLLPQAIDAEQAVLGAVLLDANVYGKVSMIIAGGDFYKEAHRRIWEAFGQLFRRGEKIDLLLLCAELSKMDKLEAVGGESYISAIIDAVPTAAGVEGHARLVRQKAVLRTIISMGTETAALAYDSGADPQELTEVAARVVMEIQREADSETGLISVKEAMNLAFENIEVAYEAALSGVNVLTGIPTGISWLDGKLGGLQNGDMIVIGGRPSMGKTAFGVLLCLAAQGRPRRVAYFSAEMPSRDIAVRLQAMRSGVSLSSIRQGRLTADEFGKITRAGDEISGWPIYIDDTSPARIDRIVSRASAMKADGGLELVVIDYLQLCQPPRDRYSNVQEQVAAMCRRLKEMARSLDVPVVVMSQLSRGSDEARKGDRRPRLSDLRDSGAIEQDADVVIFIHRPEVLRRGEPGENDKDLKGETELILAKQRNGPVGSTNIYFEGESASFYNKRPPWDGTV